MTDPGPRGYYTVGCALYGCNIRMSPNTATHFQIVVDGRVTHAVACGPEHRRLIREGYGREGYQGPDDPPQLALV